MEKNIFLAILKGAKLFRYANNESAIFVNGVRIAIGAGTYSYAKRLCDEIEFTAGENGLVIAQDTILVRWLAVDENEYAQVSNEVYDAYMDEFYSIYNRIYSYKLKIPELMSRLRDIIEQTVCDWYYDAKELNKKSSY